MATTVEADRNAWRAGVEAVLRKSGRLRDDGQQDPEELLTGRTADGLRLKPLYTAQDLPSVLPPPDAGEAGWQVCQRVVVDPAVADLDTVNDTALHLLATGATSLWLTVGPGGISPEDLGAVLSGVRPDLAPIVVTPAGGLPAAEATLAWAASHPGAQVSLGLDPVTMNVPVEAVADLVTRSAAVDGDIRVVVADGSAAVEAGGTPAQQLALAIASGITILRELADAGVDPGEVALDLRLAATDDQFASLCTMRAARLLWARVAATLGLETIPRIHAVTAEVMLSVHDPWVNLLRSTLAVFGAGAGGADLVTVTPFDARLGLSDHFAQRLARNTQSLLLMESHIGAVNDPGAGSYYVEAHTADLAAAAWALVQQIEAAGGVREALPLIAQWVDASWQERRTALATRKHPLTGVSEFPILDQAPVSREPLPPKAVEPLLTPVHYADDFEALRADATGTVPVVLLGTVASSSARAGFATNLLAAGGFSAVTVGPVTSGEEIAEALAAAQVEPGSVAMIAGTDGQYAAIGETVVETLRAQGFSYVVVAGKSAALPSADAAVAMGSNVVEQLKAIAGEMS